METNFPRFGREEPKKADPPKFEEKKLEPPKVEAKREEPKKPEPTAHKVERKVERKAEEKEPPRRNRVTVLRDLVEDLESDPNISEEQRTSFQELNRRLTRALAR